ncbi:HNH endonuclease [Streptomyces triculaminicus]|uniref:HNH endonuclease n=2 Tax=Streptomyces TaxID=1883 RepID=A0A939FRT8_9ACTN|nr:MULTISPECIES: HNH endonuclease family protein [Streptomyces]MBO0656708.1 HNH endonuclease [Streptomyces triculaminicus]QSY47848.1 HNH endonuclease [Streptomyces griseocarneus]
MRKLRHAGAGARAVVRAAAVATAAVVALAGTAGCGKDDAGGGKPDAKGKDPFTLPGLPPAGQARTQLAGLKEEAPHSMSGYSRAAFPHWAQQGNKCDTRETVLERDGKDVKRDAECRAVSGSWRSLYDGKTYTKAAQVDIDHIVPLANAWRSGADKWDNTRRKALANDLTHPQLLTVSAATNRSKGDQSPDQWQPPDRASWCVYGRAWVSVKSTYALSITADERKTLTKMLDSCTG